MNRMACMTILAATFALAGAAQAREIYVPGHYLANGRYVAPYYRQVPDAPVYPGYGAVDPEGNATPPVTYPNGVPYVAPVPYGAPYGAAPYVPAPVPNYGYVPR